MHLRARLLEAPLLLLCLRVEKRVAFAGLAAKRGDTLGLGLGPWPPRTLIIFQAAGVVADLETVVELPRVIRVRPGGTGQELQLVVRLPEPVLAPSA